MFSTKQVDNTWYFFNPDLLDEDVEHAFDIAYWRQRDAIIGSAQGRGTTWFVQGSKGAYALRHYRRGGLFGKVVKDHYLFSTLENTRAYQELETLNTLAQHGINVPRPVAAKIERSGLTYKADILIEKIDDAKDLVALLKTRELEANVLKKVGQEIRKMHDAQVNHTDLNIHNILVDTNNKVWIIDFDKCHPSNGDTWKNTNLERLKRSFKKEMNEEAPLRLPPNYWQYLLSGYSS